MLGAGLAGLAAADALKGAGYGVTMLEASDRIGGRVQTYRYTLSIKLITWIYDVFLPSQSLVVSREFSTLAGSKRDKFRSISLYVRLLNKFSYFTIN